LKLFLSLAGRKKRQFPSGVNALKLRDFVKSAQISDMTGYFLPESAYF